MSSKPSSVFFGPSHKAIPPLLLQWANDPVSKSSSSQTEPVQSVNYRSDNNLRQPIRHSLCWELTWIKQDETHTRILSGSLNSLNSAANLRTDMRSLRSKCISRTRAPGFSLRKSNFTASPRFKFRMPRITRAPLFASTRAVSIPIPAVAPATHMWEGTSLNNYSPAPGCYPGAEQSSLW